VDAKKFRKKEQCCQNVDEAVYINQITRPQGEDRLD
jgi:hypothetical protein